MLNNTVALCGMQLARKKEKNIHAGSARRVATTLSRTNPDEGWWRSNTVQHRLCLYTHPNSLEVIFSVAFQTSPLGNTWEFGVKITHNEHVFIFFIFITTTDNFYSCFTMLFIVSLSCI